MGSKPSNLDNGRFHVRVRDRTQKRRWTEYCTQHKMTISELVRDAVESIINPPVSITDAIQLREMIESLRGKVTELENEVEIRGGAIENQKRAIDDMKVESVTNDEMGVKAINDRLVEMLRGVRRLYSEHEILQRLNLTHRDRSAIRSIGNQLDWLEKFGLVETRNGKWRWIA